jgi:hypothetical protein
MIKLIIISYLIDDMLESVELRWFYKGQLPNELNTTFCNSDIKLEPESRTDYYLLIENCDSLGIKLRNSRLEIKKLKRNHIELLNKYVNGKMEQWIRWEWNDTNSFNEILQFIQANKYNPWIKIDKKRLQKKFVIFDNSLLETLQDNTHFDFSIELTELKVSEHLWWSIGIDSSKIGDNIHFFMQLIKRCINEKYQTNLKLASSYGYPEWVSKVISAEI